MSSQADSGERAAAGGYEHICLRPLTPHLGAEVFGVDLANLDAATLAEIHRAFLEYMVLVFRGQNLTQAQHKAFGRHFGALHVHPSVRHLGARGDPELFTIHTTPESRFSNGEAWHSDVSCEPVPPLASILYVRELPGPSGGDTLFANMYAAFESLSPPMQQLLAELDAVHDGRKDLAAYGYHLKPDQTYPCATHPVVVRHPETGRRLLFVNSSFTSHIVGVSRAESDALLGLLFNHIEAEPRCQCRVRWEPGTVTLWDNRCTQHHAVWDYHPHTRHAERVTVAGHVAPAR
ncbi:MAG: TauD/TfdA family dioxygenase [Pseudomonadales bacterium]